MAIVWGVTLAGRGTGTPYKAARMPAKLGEKEIQAVTNLPPGKRYLHFVKRVADWEEVWGLVSQDNKWILAGDPNVPDCFPVWPHRDYAALCANAEWSGHSPRAISLDAYMENWLPDSARKGLLVAVFLTAGLNAAVVTPDRLLADLQNECEWYE